MSILRRIISNWKERWTGDVHWKRRLQEKGDVHLLYLLTSFHRSGRQLDLDAIHKETEQLSFQEQKEVVQDNLHRQVKYLAGHVGDILGRPVGRSMPRGLGMMMSEPSSQDAAPTCSTRPELEYATQELYGRVGYTLDLRPSLIESPYSGTGLFAVGDIEAGSVVAFYPGVVYTPRSYKYMAGYPKVDTNNPYLMMRYDKVLVDGKSWGMGAGEKGTFPWGPQTADDAPNLPNRLLRGDMSARGEVQARLEAEARLVATANPLAFGHFANHPSKGCLPNVVVAQYDLELDPRSVAPQGSSAAHRPHIQQGQPVDDLRWFIPNVRCGTAQDWMQDKPDDDGTIKERIPALLFVACRDIESEEEILLNYRLSPGLSGQPVWYNPVDQEAEDRLWAQY